MNEVLLVFCTFPDAAQARQIGTLLVERQLAACVNLIPAVESIYRWEGKVDSAMELLAVFKTTTSVFPEFEATLSDLHPYEVPEIIALQPHKVVGPYAAWVLESVPSK